MCTSHVLIVWICRKIEYLELRKSDWKLCTQDVRIACFCKKAKYPKLRKFNGKLCTLYVWNVWIYRKIELCEHFECAILRKSNEKLCTINAWIVWIQSYLNILNCLNSMGNCIHYMYGFFEFTESLNSAECMELHKFIGKLCRLYVRIV